MSAGGMVTPIAEVKPNEYGPVMPVARCPSLKVVEDCAQAVCHVMRRV